MLTFFRRLIITYGVIVIHLFDTLTVYCLVISRFSFAVSRPMLVQNILKWTLIRQIGITVTR